MHPDHSEHEAPRGFWGTRSSIGLLVFGAVAAYFLLTEHLAHVVGALPFLLLAACALMHLFMHGGHGGHHHGAESGSDGTKKPNQSSPGEPS